MTSYRIAALAAASSANAALPLLGDHGGGHRGRDHAQSEDPERQDRGKRGANNAWGDQADYWSGLAPISVNRPLKMVISFCWPSLIA
jgi:hypothetical protein